MVLLAHTVSSMSYCHPAFYLSLTHSIYLSTIGQITSSPTVVDQCSWNLARLLIMMGGIRGVREFWAHGLMWAHGPKMWNNSKCFFSHKFHYTVLLFNHDDTLMALPSGCSGISGPKSHLGQRAHFMIFGPLSGKCFFSYKCWCTVLMFWHNCDPLVVSSGCSWIFGLRSHLGPRANFMILGPLSGKCFLSHKFWCTMLMFGHNGDPITGLIRALKKFWSKVPFRPEGPLYDFESLIWLSIRALWYGWSWSI